MELRVIGALFNKDKLEKKLWEKVKPVDIDIEQIMAREDYVATVVKGKRLDEQLFKKEIGEYQEWRENKRKKFVLI